MDHGPCPRTHREKSRASIFLKLLNEFYHIYRCTAIITTKFPSISIPNPQHIPPPPNLSHLETVSFSSICFLFCFVLFCLFRAAFVAYGISQARADLRHNHSNARAETHSQTMPQLATMLDPLPTERGQGSKLHPHGY